MRDRTQEVREIVERYKDIEFIPLRIQDAFDPAWWKRVSNTSSSRISVDLSTESMIATTFLYSVIINKIG